MPDQNDQNAQSEPEVGQADATEAATAPTSRDADAAEATTGSRETSQDEGREDAAGARDGGADASSDRAGASSDRTGTSSEKTDASPDGAGQGSGAKAQPTMEEREKTFTVLENALANADWGYENKSDDAREIGHKSVMTAEQAFIRAAVMDRKQAVGIYENAAGRPPSEKLMARVDEAERKGGMRSLDDLTADIVKTGEKRERNALESRAREIDDKLSGWSTTLGDMRSRSLQHRDRMIDGLLSKEKPQDDGLHLLAAFGKGLRSGEEYHQMMRQRGLAGAKHAEFAQDEKTLVEIRNKQRKLNGEEPVPTTGPTGRIVQRFQGAFEMATATVAGRRKKEAARDGATVGEAPDAARQSDIHRAAAAARAAAMGRAL